MSRLSVFALSIHRSLWFLPTVIVLAAVAAAVGLVEAQAVIGSDLSERWPRLLGAGAEGARAMLGAIATSMITVAGVVFSITIVALSLASSQYSPRVLRNFMSDRPTQVVLGAFVAVFAYCMVVLRTIRGPDEGAFVPSLAVLGGVVMAFAGVGLLIYFIHHVASAIQVTSIVSRIASEAEATIARNFPERADAFSGDGTRAAQELAEAPHTWTVEAPRTGYVVAADIDGLFKLAVDHDSSVRLLPMVGDFVIERRPLLCVTSEGPLDRKTIGAVRDHVTIGSSRDAHQDLRYTIEQLVDIALRTLSPGIHDPATACTCIDHLAALLVRLPDRPLSPIARYDRGRLRVAVDGPSFDDCVRLAFTPIVHHAATHAPVYERLVAAFQAIAEACADASRRSALLEQLEELRHRTADADLPPLERYRLQSAADAVRSRWLSPTAATRMPKAAPATAPAEDDASGRRQRA